MGNAILIDGYNLLHQIPEMKRMLDTEPDQARNLLLHRLSAYAQKNNAKITIIFDGHRPAQAQPRFYTGLTVQFSRNESADAVIKRMADTPRGVSKPVVITSDQEIVRFVKHCGAETQTSQSFARAMAATKAKKIRIEDKYEPPMSKGEVEEWMRLFKGE